MRRLASLILVLGACDTVFRLDHVPRLDAPPPDGPCTSFSKLVDTCALGDPADWQADVVITAAVQDSSIFGNFRNVDSPTGMLHVVLVKKLDVLGGSTLNLVAGKPFVIVSDGDINVLGTIHTNAGSRIAGECALAAGSRGTNDTGGASGGGGGGFGSAGGNGGRGDLDGLQVNGGPGGAATSLPDGLLAGCPGGPGGDASGGQTAPGGAGGAGGGAVALISRTSVTVAGLVIAPGGGGTGGTGTGSASTGGGGGGAGGMIWIEAPAIGVSGALAANGGGGGEGAAGGNGMTGKDAASGDAAAPGGTGAGNGGDGGAGGHLSHPAGYASTDFLNGGGGGGGGGVGFIVLVGTAQITGSLSPEATPAP